MLMLGLMETAVGGRGRRRRRECIHIGIWMGKGRRFRRGEGGKRMLCLESPRESRLDRENTPSQSAFSPSIAINPPDHEGIFTADTVEGVVG